MKHLGLINPERVTEDEVATYPVREAVRAVVFDQNNSIALLHVTRENYYKIPGGGIEGSEDKKDALTRECLEEIGSDIEIIGEVGSITEYRKMFKLKQISYCYIAKLKGEKGTPHFTDDERENGFENVWLPYNEACTVVSNNRANGIEGREYIVPRETIIFKAVAELLSN